MVVRGLRELKKRQTREQAVRTRAPGEPALAAFRRQLLDSGGLLARVGDGDRDALAQLRTVNRVIADSPTLQAREQRAFADCADARVVVYALLGVRRQIPVPKRFEPTLHTRHTNWLTFERAVGGADPFAAAPSLSDRGNTVATGRGTACSSSCRDC